MVPNNWRYDHPFVSSVSFFVLSFKNMFSDFIWDFGKLPFPSHLGNFFNDFGEKIPKIHKIGKIQTIF